MQTAPLINRQSSIATSLDSYHNNFDVEKTTEECTYATLLRSPLNFNVYDGRPDCHNSLAGASQSTARIPKKHNSAKKSIPELCHVVETYNEGNHKIIDFFRYLKQCIAESWEVGRTIDDIVVSLLWQNYNDTEKKVQKFLESKLPFTKDLIDKLSDVHKLQQWMLEVLEQKEELEARYQSFKESREVWSYIYRVFAWAFSVVSTLLISLAAPPVAIAAIPVVVSIVAVGDRTFELWANSNEANMRWNIEKAQKIITVAEDPHIEMHELHIVRNNFKKLVSKVHSVVRKSVNGEFEVSIDDNLLKKRI